MNYREPPPARSYLCPGCSTPQPGPAQGGPVTCAQCRTPFTLPDRSAMLANPGYVASPDNDPARLAQLRVQDGRPRLVAPTLQAVLGGSEVLPGREAEAIAIWQSLRARSQAGDVGASEDMTTLSVLVSQLPATQQQPALAVALCESAYDAAVLPRHKQEQLGRLVRLAVAAGDRASAQRYLSWMMPNAPELEADSDFRLSAAMAATLDRDAQRVLALLGPQKDAIPIADSLDPMASVLRANAYETLGNVQAASQILRELPDPRMLGLIRSRFPAIQLCPQSASAYETSTAQQAAQRAASGASFVGYIVGAALGLPGIILLLVGLSMILAGGANIGGFINLGIGSVLLVVGVVAVAAARAKAKKTAWLRTNGLSLVARVVNVEQTGTMINNVPVFRFILQVQGPHGPYAASFTKLVPVHQVASIMGQQIRVRANPQQLSEVILED